MKKNLFFVLIILILFFFSIVYGFLVLESKRVNDRIDMYINFEHEFANLSENILSDPIFSEEGIYLIHFDKGEVNIEVFDFDNNRIKEFSASQYYTELCNNEWFNPDISIEIATYSSHNKEISSSVTLKQQFYLSKMDLWIYYGDSVAFPSCPYEWSKRDNISKLSEDLYYAIGWNDNKTIRGRFCD